MDSVVYARVDTVSLPRTRRVVCTAEARAGIVIDIQDSVTGVPLALRALVVTTRDGQVDSVRHLRTAADMPEADDERRLWMWLAWEQPGTYDIAIHVKGYAVWRRTGVVVQAGPCHVVPTRLVARLVPE